MSMKPNILITGTPGVGKSTICEKLSILTGLEWINIGKIAEENSCLNGYDSVYKCPILDEDLVIDILDDKISQRGYIVDYHSCDFFPKRWFDVVFVLRARTDVLYDRLKERGYYGKKLEDDIQCEIFQMILEEAKESYDEDIVFELQNNEPQDLETNCYKIIEWMKSKQFK